MLRFFFATGSKSHYKTKEIIHLGSQRVRKLLSEHGTSLPDICLKIESAENKDELKVAFAVFNKVICLMALTAPLNDESGIISKTLKELKFSDKLGYFLNSAPSPHHAILAYKTAVVEELAERLDNLDKFTRNCDRFEDSLFSRYFGGVSSTALGAKDAIHVQLTELSEKMLSPCGKRKLSSISEDPSLEYAGMGPNIKSDKNEMSFNIISSVRKRRRCGFSS